MPNNNVNGEDVTSEQTVEITKRSLSGLIEEYRTSALTHLSLWESKRYTIPMISNTTGRYIEKKTWGVNERKTHKTLALADNEPVKSWPRALIYLHLDRSFRPATPEEVEEYYKKITPKMKWRRANIDELLSKLTFVTTAIL